MNGFPSELNPISGKRVEGGKGKVLLTRSDFRPFLFFPFLFLPVCFSGKWKWFLFDPLLCAKKAVGPLLLLKGTRWKEEEGWFGAIQGDRKKKGHLGWRLKSQAHIHTHKQTGRQACRLGSDEPNQEIIPNTSFSESKKQSRYENFPFWLMFYFSFSRHLNIFASLVGKIHSRQRRRKECKRRRKRSLLQNQKQTTRFFFASPLTLEVHLVRWGRSFLGEKRVDRWVLITWGREGALPQFYVILNRLRSPITRPNTLTPKKAIEGNILTLCPKTLFSLIQKAREIVGRPS